MLPFLFILFFFHNRLNSSLSSPPPYSTIKWPLSSPLRLYTFMYGIYIIFTLGSLFLSFTVSTSFSTLPLRIIIYVYLHYLYSWSSFHIFQSVIHFLQVLFEKRLFYNFSVLPTQHFCTIPFLAWTLSSIVAR